MSKEPRKPVIAMTSAKVFEMIDAARDSGAATGKRVAYGDILDYLGERLAEAEAALTANPDSPLALAECMVLSRLVDFYTGAPESFQRQAHVCNLALAELGMRAGLFPKTARANIQRAHANGTL